MSLVGARAAGVALAGGGAVWTAWCLALAFGAATVESLQPAVAASGLALGLGLGGLVWRLSWTYQFPGGEGATLGCLGALTLGVAQAALALWPESGAALWLLAAGVLQLVAGACLLGAGLARARRTPPWIGIAVALSAVLFLGFERYAPLGLPFGAAWVALGTALWRRPNPPSAPLEPSARRRGENH